MHQLKLQLSPSDPMALERVLMTCRIRRCEIVAMSFGAGVAEISVAGEPRRVRGMVACLSRLVGVLNIDAPGTRDADAT